MAIYMITTWVPFHKLEDLEKLMPNAPSSISHIKKWLIYSTTDGKKGRKTYNIVYIEEGKVDEVQIKILKLLNFFHGVEGYSYKIEPLISSRDIQKIAAL